MMGVSAGRVAWMKRPTASVVTLTVHAGAQIMKNTKIDLLLTLIMESAVFAKLFTTFGFPRARKW